MVQMSRPMEFTREQISQMLTNADPDTAAVIRARLKLIESLRMLTGALDRSSEAMCEMTEAATRMSEALEKLNTTDKEEYENC